MEVEEIETTVMEDIEAIKPEREKEKGSEASEN